MIKPVKMAEMTEIPKDDWIVSKTFSCISSCKFMKEAVCEHVGFIRNLISSKIISCNRCCVSM